VEWQLFNSKEFVAQNRERVFIIGHLRGAGTKKIFLSQEKKDQLIKNQEGSI
jgi:DNA (cytosine-5)-methyltransferase 1